MISVLTSTRNSGIQLVLRKDIEVYTKLEEQVGEEIKNQKYLWPILG
jgi:hypothetical protein